MSLIDVDDYVPQKRKQQKKQEMKPKKSKKRGGKRGAKPKCLTTTNKLIIYRINGYDDDDIDMLLQEGFSPEEIEEFIYT